MLSKGNVTTVTLIYFLIVLLLKNKSILKRAGEIYKILQQRRFFSLSKSKLAVFLILLIFIQVTVNLIGALGPEHAFDALWYHLTLPKIFLLNHEIGHIPGGLLFYSDMPKLTEMFYLTGLSIGNEILVKIIHFSFGLLSMIALYQLSRKFLSPLYSLLVLVVFYANLVVAWESTTAYIDLTRTFFEVMALWGFVNWWESQKRFWLTTAAVMTGFAVSTKLLALGSIVIFSILILIFFYYKRTHYKVSFRSLLLSLIYYTTVALLIPLPWFISSYLSTGNPVYPFFTNLYPTTVNIALLNPLNFIKDIGEILLHAADPISPIYFIFLPLILIFRRKIKPKARVILFYSMLSLLVWYITPRTGGGRFILPYLPGFSLLVAIVLHDIKDKSLHFFLISTIIFVSLTTIFYRMVTNAKYIPVILGLETKEVFLSSHLNFTLADFYDVDQYFEKQMTMNDRVLLYGFHNLYYIDFPFIDSSWIKKGDWFNYIAVQNGSLPERFSNWQLVYENSKTGICLYTLNKQKVLF
ncbi:MAG: hypothetical protein M1142_01280 [Patescibacteria group bacterium]|nr:hypothetical protein [Patescibacteria group bacterium]